MCVCVCASWFHHKQSLFPTASSLKLESERQAHPWTPSRLQSTSCSEQWQPSGTTPCSSHRKQQQNSHPQQQELSSSEYGRYFGVGDTLALRGDGCSNTEHNKHTHAHTIHIHIFTIHRLETMGRSTSQYKFGTIVS